MSIPPVKALSGLALTIAAAVAVGSTAASPSPSAGASPNGVEAVPLVPQTNPDVLEIVPLVAQPPKARTYTAAVTFDVTVKGTQTTDWKVVQCAYQSVGSQPSSFESVATKRLTLVAVMEDNGDLVAPLVPDGDVLTAEFQDPRTTQPRFEVAARSSESTSFSQAPGCDPPEAGDAPPKSNCQDQSLNLTFELMRARGGKLGLSSTGGNAAAWNCAVFAVPGPLFSQFLGIDDDQGYRYIADGPPVSDLLDPTWGKFIARGSASRTMTTGESGAWCVDSCRSVTTINWEITLTRVKSVTPRKPKGAVAQAKGGTVTASARTVKGAVGYRATLTPVGATATGAGAGTRQATLANRRPSFTFRKVPKGRYSVSIAAIGPKALGPGAARRVTVR